MPQVSQPALPNAVWLWPHHWQGCDLCAAELQEAVLSPSGKLCPHHKLQPGRRGGSRTWSQGGEGGFLQEHHSSRFAVDQRKETRHLSECREERGYDPWQQAWGKGDAQEGAAKSPAILLRDHIFRKHIWTSFMNLLKKVLCFCMNLYLYLTDMFLYTFDMCTTQQVALSITVNQYTEMIP